MALFKKIKFREHSDKKVEIPNGLWVKCDACKETLYNKQLDETLRVCPKCGHHLRLSAKDRIKMLVDEGTWMEIGNEVKPTDPLNFPEYKEKLKKSQAATGLDDAIITGEGKVNGVPASFGVTDSNFMMGSMGSVMGEKITRAVEHAIKRKIPVVLVSSSGGGARMQEGILSLMQMAKTSAALKKLSNAGLPYIALLTDPTGGGVTASWGMLGDITIAEPNAFILFAGPRVIEQTIRQKLPKGFQRAEFLQEHGFVDMVVHRKELKERLGKILKFFA